ncbi:MAG TPA: hypothetical protein DCE85_12050, partial [Sulfitobacter sp.]|nr:hypothetical protein [Sulfitobacter sp.]
LLHWFHLGISVLAYFTLDGFDLGVGLLPPLETRDRRDRMIAAVETFFKSIKAELIWRHP